MLSNELVQFLLILIVLRLYAKEIDQFGDFAGNILLSITVIILRILKYPLKWLLIAIIYPFHLAYIAFEALGKPINKGHKK